MLTIGLLPESGTPLEPNWLTVEGGSGSRRSPLISFGAVKAAYMLAYSCRVISTHARMETLPIKPEVYPVAEKLTSICSAWSESCALRDSNHKGSVTTIAFSADLYGCLRIRATSPLGY